MIVIYEVGVTSFFSLADDNALSSFNLNLDY